MADPTTSREPLVLHSGPLRLALSWTTPLMLLALGLYGLSERVWGLTIGVTVAGVVAAAVVLFDLPIRSEFDAAGVTRVCPLRRQRLLWSSVVAVERVHLRQRSSMVDALTGRGRDRQEGGRRAARPAQGLVARTGPRRLSLLVDRRESFVEYDELRALLRDQATVLRATPPPIDSAPAGRGRRALHRRPGRD